MAWLGYNIIYTANGDCTETTLKEPQLYRKCYGDYALPYASLYTEGVIETRKVWYFPPIRSHVINKPMYDVWLYVTQSEP